jgi:hypothetical protein
MARVRSFADAAGMRGSSIHRQRWRNEISGKREQ